PGIVDFIEKNRKRRIIMTWHNDPIIRNDTIYKILVSIYRLIVFPKVVSKLDKIILPSETLMHHSKFIKMIPLDKISVIPNAVDVEKFSPGDKTKKEYKKELNISSKFLVIFVAGMDPQHAYKGAEFLLQAIKQIKDLDIIF